MDKKSIHTEKFEAVFNQLNKEQQAAVNQIDGPVMVIAGPGTGKTQILSARIAAILLNTDVLPKNILCLTYTDAGVVAMRKRLIEMIGSAAYQLSIYTYHAFCNDIIQENMRYFNRSNAHIITDLEKHTIVEAILNALPAGHLLKKYKSNFNFEIRHLLELYANIKKENWTVDFLVKKINEYIKELPFEERFVAKRASGTYKKGDIREDKIAIEKEKLEKLIAAVETFNTYQTALEKNEQYDYEDMLRWVVNAFEKNTTLLLQYQEQYQYILVDEFQDSNGIQNYLINLLLNYWDSPNIFVVGDDDQSIYRFQGASMDNMLQFATQYQQYLKTIVLTRNYRSSQPILDSSFHLISNNQERLVNKLPQSLEKKLLASNPKVNSLSNAPILVSYENEYEEMLDITLQIESLIQQGIEPNAIAVLYKEHRYGNKLIEYFNLKNIPYYTKRNMDILEHRFIQKIIQILAYLNAELTYPYSGDAMLVELFHFAEWQINPIEIAEQAAKTAEEQRAGRKISLRKNLWDKSHQPPKTLFETNLSPQFKKAVQCLENLVQQQANLPLPLLMQQIIYQTGFLKNLLNEKNKVQNIQLLTTWYEFVDEELTKNPFLTLKSFLDIVQSMQKEKLPLPLYQTLGNEKGVNLLTLHGSKGWEFDYVFMPNANSKNWEKKRANANGYSFPENIIAASADNDEDLRRLFFVGITRAAKFLQISYQDYNIKGELTEPSKFVIELSEATKTPIQAKAVNPDMLEIAAHLFTPQPVVLDPFDKDWIAAKLANFRLSATALNQFLDCPLGFYFESIINVPIQRNENLEFGSAIHFALQRLFEKMLTHPTNAFPPMEAMLKDFDWYMYKHQAFFTAVQFEKRLEYGHILLQDYYEQFLPDANKIVLIEQNIKNVVFENVPLKGKLDKLEFDGNRVTIIDYKTGSLDAAEKKLHAPTEKSPTGGSYWRQGIFYKILVDNFPNKNWTTNAVVFDFIEPDKTKKYRKISLDITPTDYATVALEITTSWEKIMQQQFYTGCGKPECYWCNMVRDSKNSAGLSIGN